jgi:hypothetical protein
MNDIEIYYNAICKKWPKPMPPWLELDPQRQIMFLQAFNLLIGALN